MSEHRIDSLAESEAILELKARETNHFQNTEGGVICLLIYRAAQALAPRVILHFISVFSVVSF